MEKKDQLKRINVPRFSWFSYKFNSLFRRFWIEIPAKRIMIPNSLKTIKNKLLKEYDQKLYDDEIIGLELSIQMYEYGYLIKKLESNPEINKIKILEIIDAMEKVLEEGLQIQNARLKLFELYCKEIKNIGTIDAEVSSLLGQKLDKKVTNNNIKNIRHNLENLKLYKNILTEKM